MTKDEPSEVYLKVPPRRKCHALITQTGSRFRRRAVRLLPAIATDEEALAKLIELGVA
jgi:hypothetical protein